MPTQATLGYWSRPTVQSPDCKKRLAKSWYTACETLISYSPSAKLACLSWRCGPLVQGNSGTGPPQHLYIYLLWIGEGMPERPCVSGGQKKTCGSLSSPLTM